MTQTFIQPPSCLLVGPTGTGKTSSLVTQLLHGLEVFVVVTEPSGVDSLLDAAERLKAPIDKLHWAYCAPAGAGWDDLENMLKMVSTSTQQQLADQKNMGKASFLAPAMKFLNCFRNFHCDRTNKDYGDVTTWDDSRSLNIDSLTGWGLIAWGCVVGYKPTANPGEWGIAQNVIYNLLNKINPDRRCFFNLTAHVEKEQDELSGVKKLMVSTIGAKLAPKIPPLFSEVIRCNKAIDAKNQPDFSWSTISNEMDLKNRALPIKTYMPADFGPVVAAYRRRKESAEISSANPLEGASIVATPPDGEPSSSEMPKAKVFPSAPITPNATR